MLHVMSKLTTGMVNLIGLAAVCHGKLTVDMNGKLRTCMPVSRHTSHTMRRVHVRSKLHRDDGEIEQRRHKLHQRDALLLGRHLPGLLVQAVTTQQHVDIRYHWVSSHPGRGLTLHVHERLAIAFDHEHLLGIRRRRICLCDDGLWHTLTLHLHKLHAMPVVAVGIGLNRPQVHTVG